MGFYAIAGIAALLATSCLFVLVYDVITQCDYFNARSLKIDGGQHLDHKQIVAVARVKKGTNIMAANLAMIGFMSACAGSPRWASTRAR